MKQIRTSIVNMVINKMINRELELKKKQTKKKTENNKKRTNSLFREREKKQLQCLALSIWLPCQPNEATMVTNRYRAKPCMMVILLTCLSQTWVRKWIQTLINHFCLCIYHFIHIIFQYQLGFNLYAKVCFAWLILHKGETNKHGTIAPNPTMLLPF